MLLQLDFTTYQWINLILGAATSLLLGIIALGQYKLNKRQVEKPDLQPVGFIRTARDEETQFTNFRLLFKNEGPGDARRTKISNISFFGMYGERSPENPTHTELFSPDFVSPSPSHITEGEISSFVLTLPEGEMEDRPNEIDRITVHLQTERTRQSVKFMNKYGMAKGEPNYEGESDYYSDTNLRVNWNLVPQKWRKQSE